MATMNWDDLKYFLAVCRHGSIRSAAKHLDVNHATVSRRINHFEERLNQRLFERTPQGYERTKAAEDIYLEASHLEERLNSVERKVVGKDRALSGEIRVTLADVLAQELMMEGFAEFAHLYPKIHLDVVDSARSFNLSNREADVAIRVCHEPPEHLVGRKVATMHRACYLARKFETKMEDPDWLAQQNWIGWNDKMRRPVGQIAREYPKFESRHGIVSAVLQSQACRLGMGVSVLPCFIGDSDPQLVRIPPYTSEPKYDVWVLSHPDMRHNTRVQTFIRFVIQFFETKRPLIEGESFNQAQL